MSGQVCEPCARRKVRCDKQQPCSNCKRRKQDKCTYPELATNDRIRRLEALVESLGGDPNTEETRLTKRVRLETSSAEAAQVERDPCDTTKSGSAQPIMLEQDGQSYYVEARAWHSCIGQGANQQNEDERDMLMSRHLLARTKPDALQSVLHADHTIDLGLQHPSTQDANVLWDNYERNANPLIKIDLDLILERLRSNSTNTVSRAQLTDVEHAFVFCLYLMSIVSMSEEECTRDLLQSKHVLLSQFQIICEQALSRTNLFCITDLMVLRALMLYVTASLERLSVQSLFSLMGLAIRNAEKLGIHRDGTLLGLTPIETERRRRLWWQLQQLDLALGVRTGTTPLTLMAGWDAKIPLNIEDADLKPDMTESPPEHKGLTSLSYCLWPFWVVSQQREFFSGNQGKLGISWASNKSVPHAAKQILIDRLEEGLNQKFLQYCDPIKSLDSMMQLAARALICTMRMFTLHPMASSEDTSITDEERHRQLLETSIKSIEYSIALNTRPEVQRFQWFIEGYFHWHAFITIIVEALQQKDPTKSRRVWNLLSDLYSANKHLSRLSDDRRKLHAAELVVSAWKTRQANDPDVGKPRCVSIIEPLLLNHRPELLPTMSETVGQPLEPVMTETDLDAMLDLDFQDIDWGFWAGIV